jgi:hypothetical protein
MKALLIAAALCAAIAVPAAAEHGHGKGKHKGHRPDVIQLPVGFQPEGIATAKRHTFYVGSVENGAVYRGSLRSGQGAVLVPGAAGHAATGMKVDRRHRLFVSGAGSHAIRVYDARTGAELRSYDVAGSGFINDVVVTRRGAYFTDSGVKQLYFIPFGDHGALGDLQRIQLTGDLQYDDDPNTFELNGIEKARGGNALIAVQSRNGKLFTIDPQTGATKEIALDKPVLRGDGLLRVGRKLYVVRNADNLVAVVKLRRNLTTGRYAHEIKSGEFHFPTTIARSGGRNYVVNAKFDSPNPATDTYQVVKVPKK